MPRLSRKERLQNEAILEQHRLATEAEPVTPEEAKTWLASLSTLDGAEGNRERLRICRDLLRHAPEDHMLDSDGQLIKAAIVDLEEELSHAVFHTRRRRAPAQPSVVGLRDDDDDSADLDVYADEDDWTAHPLLDDDDA